MIEDLREPIRLLKQGQLEMAADLMADVVVNQAMKIKRHICHNGPEDLSPLVVFAGAKAMAMGEIIGGSDSDESINESLAETLVILRKEIDEPALIVGLCDEVIMGNQDPDGETMEEMLAAGRAEEALMVTMVHHYGDDYRVAQLMVRFTFSDGEVQFNPKGFAHDTVFRPDSCFTEVGSATTQVILDFFKEVNDES